MAGWVETATGTNAIATASRASAAVHRPVIYGVSASFSAAATQLLQIKNGATVVWEGYIYTSRDVTFPAGIALPAGSTITAVLAASGSAGIVGKVSLHGADL